MYLLTTYSPILSLHVSSDYLQPHPSHLCNFRLHTVPSCPSMYLQTTYSPILSLNVFSDYLQPHPPSEYLQTTYSPNPIPQCIFRLLTAPILSLNVSSDLGSWNQIKLTITQIIIFSNILTLSRILGRQSLNDLPVRFTNCVQNPVGHLFGLVSLRCRLESLSISIKLE